MIIFLIGVALLIIGIIFVNVSYGDWVYVLSSILCMLMTCFLLISAIGILELKVTEEADYQAKMYEREVLEYRLNRTEESLIGNEMLFNDIVEFNNELRKVKIWSNNPFTNWYYSKKIASIDYIELE